MVTRYRTQGCLELFGLDGRSRDGYTSSMARLPLVNLDDPNVDPGVRALLAELDRQPYGASNVIRAMANHPGLLRNSAQFVYGPDAHITTAQRELAYLTASVVNSCHY